MREPMTETRLAEVRERAASGAKSGQWYDDVEQSSTAIAVCRTDVPELLDEIDRCRPMKGVQAGALFPAPMTDNPCEHCCGTGYEIDQRELGRSLAESRLSLGIRQNFVAERMGVSNAWLSELERGTRNWKRATVVKFWEALRGKP